MGNNSSVQYHGSAKYIPPSIFQEARISTIDSLGSLDKFQIPVGMYNDNSYLPEFDLIKKSFYNDIVRTKYLGNKEFCCMNQINHYWTDKDLKIISDSQTTETPNLVTCDPDTKIIGNCTEIFFNKCFNKNNEINDKVELVCIKLFKNLDDTVNKMMYEDCKDNMVNDKVRCSLWMKILRLSKDPKLNALADNVLMNQKDKSFLKCLNIPKEILNEQLKHSIPLECWYGPCNREPIENLTSENLKKRKLCYNINCDISVNNFNISDKTTLNIICNNSKYITFEENLTNKKFETLDTFFVNLKLEFTVILIILFLIFLYYEFTNYPGDKNKNIL